MADSDRDLLWDLIDERLPEVKISRCDHAGLIADAILAAGWHPPARQIPAHPTPSKGAWSAMSKYENVTSWSGRRRHYVEPGAQHLLCGSGIVVRPGDEYVATHRSVLTQARIDAMWLCAACERVAAKRQRPAETEAAVKLLAYALHLRMHGERAPGGDETWKEWDDRTERFLRSLTEPIG